MEEEQKKDKQDPGIPAWVMTFADLMSLLLAFFVLLFSFSELDKLRYKQIAGSMKDAFGVQREVKIKDPPRGINIIAKEFSAGRPEPTPLNVVKQHTTDHLRAYLKVPKAMEDQRKDDDGSKSSDISKLRKAIAKEIAKIIAVETAKLRQLLEKEIDSGLIEIETEGEKIVIRIREKGSFNSGQAKLYSSFRPVLRKMAQALSQTKGDIVIAGHTDNVPIYTELYRSNWELSSARAVTVLHELLEVGTLPAERFQVSGYANTRPLVSNNSADERAKNRRVEITVVYGKDNEQAMSILEQLKLEAESKSDSATGEAQTAESAATPNTENTNTPGDQQNIPITPENGSTP